MAVNGYICLNGEYFRAEEPCLFTHNRAFRYGDAVSENIHAYATEPQFLDYHIEKLRDSMHLLAMDTPAWFKASDFRALITRLLNKNRLFGGTGVRITVYRENSEEFIPVNGRTSFIIESFSLQHDRYELNEKGYSLDISGNYTKNKGPLSTVRNASSLIYLLSGIEGRKSNLDATLLLNEGGRLVEAVNSNVFLVSVNSIFTPGINEGCIPGVMRRVIIRLASEAGFTINDQSSLTPAALEDAEEVFLTNSLEGIRWVGAYRQRRYYKKTAKLLTIRLNDFAFNS